MSHPGWKTSSRYRGPWCWSFLQNQMQQGLSVMTFWPKQDSWYDEDWSVLGGVNLHGQQPISSDAEVDCSSCHSLKGHRLLLHTKTITISLPWNSGNHFSFSNRVGGIYTMSAELVFILQCFVHGNNCCHHHWLCPALLLVLFCSYFMLTIILWNRLDNNEYCLFGVKYYSIKMLIIIHKNRYIEH